MKTQLIVLGLLVGSLPHVFAQDVPHVHLFPIAYNGTSHVAVVAEHGEEGVVARRDTTQSEKDKTLRPVTLQFMRMSTQADFSYVLQMRTTYTVDSKEHARVETYIASLGELDIDKEYIFRNTRRDANGVPFADLKIRLLEQGARVVAEFSEEPGYFKVDAGAKLPLPGGTVRIEAVAHDN